MMMMMMTMTTSKLSMYLSSKMY